MKRLLLPALLLLISSCATTSRLAVPAAIPADMRAEPWVLFDSARQRAVPVVLYLPTGANTRSRLKPAILSHGYGGQNTAYTFLARTLVAHGYLVASIQHELPTDAPMPTTGEVRVVRRPWWERGAQNIEFVRQALHRRYRRLQANRLLLAGHSNGGDISMLYVAEHPGRVARVISLDNRRVPLPRARRPRVLSLRSSDQVADPGVLPTPAEQRQFGTVILPLPHTIHNDMWDGATEAQKVEMKEAVARFLTN
ncbi:alpha/beta hydrolase [Hymenobacter properus]|uniref:Alpha/beta hydrolase n=1 Tax=Hymenobacter properus TaxID=2791026 RepID=A0A931BDV8_9BACT|nr:alpha/beta hydrolase [Hymenobacter properus]MBF9140492.1 alpha/beta hydrolase [Hymenobacter properus]MBR7719299.1 alpha/beta hydrolase [Microvirga sp. SRT04]